MPTKEQYAKNRDYYFLYAQRRRRDYPDEERVWRRNSYLKNGRQWHFKKKYGITVDDYDLLLTRQDGKCAICQTSTPNGKGSFLQVDHDHKTGKVRGLLCFKCNSALGLLDTEQLLEKAREYLHANHQSVDPSST